MAIIVTRAGKGSALSYTEADANFTNLNNDKLEATAYNAADVLTKVKSVDGTGSGLDADLLDGNEAAAFAAAVHTHVKADITDLTINPEKIEQGNSKVEIVDAGTGSIIYTVDGVVEMRNDPGSLTFSPAGFRVLADLSNATLASRTYFKSLTTNDNTSLGVVPNGSATQAEFAAVDDATPTNASSVHFGTNGTNAYIISTRTGSGTTLPLYIQTGDSPATRMWIGPTGKVNYGCVEHDAGNSSTSITLNFMANGANQKMTLTGNVSVTLTAPLAGTTCKLKILTGTGSFTVTFSTTVKWPGGAAYVATTAASKTDIVTLYYDGSAWWGQYGNNYA
jgi:hypothetical protein